jgi:nitroimidazol reductase NimA-like FMN-containing flavoprotein (pyridoxamine 5'-phosphate oxidase superfamily)
MTKFFEEPAYLEKTEVNQNEIKQNQISEKIKNMLNNESFAVLSTQGGGQPYTSLITFTAGTDLRTIVFATPVNTKKFELISNCENVSILVDNRSENIDELNKISAITVTGKAHTVETQEEIEKYRSLILEKHPYLENFVLAESSALIMIEVEKYFHVSNFQEVQEWKP